MLYSRRETVLSRLWGLLFVLGAALFPWEALAADNTLGSIVCNVKNNLGAYPYIVNATGFTVGAFFSVRGILLLRKNAENASQSPATPGIAHLVIGGFLLSLSAFIGVLQKTVFGSSLGGAGEFGCNASVPTEISGTAGLDQIIQNFVQNVHRPMFMLLSLISIAAGLTFIVGGLMRGAKTGTDPRAAAPKDVIAHLLFGAILISIGTALPDVLQSLFGSGSISSMTNIELIQWSKITGSEANTKAIVATERAVLAFIQIIGGISFVRGWLLLKKAVEGGQATLPQGFTHIIGGAMAINIDVMLRAIDKTFGTGILS